MKNTTTLGLIASSVLALAACGGGSDSNDNTQGAGATPPPPAASTPTGSTPTPTPRPTPTNAIEKHLVEGDYVMWGFSFIMNDVAQVFVSQETVDAGGLPVSTKIAGQVTSAETPPSLFDFASAVSYRDQDGATQKSCSPKVTFDGADQATVSCVQANLASVKWTIKLTSEDVSGKLVKDHVRNGVGVPVSAKWANEAATFAAGSSAYTVDYLAAANMLVSPRIPVWFSTSPVSSGWCQPVPGQNTRLGVALNADKSTSLYEVSGTQCAFAGLTAVGTGSWELSPLNGGTNVYKVKYPDAVTGDAKWAPLFTQAKSPTARMATVIQPCNLGWCLAYEVQQGDRFQSAQPHFNAAALPGLKAAAGLQ